MIDRDAIDADLARRLVAEQFPQWAGLPVTPVAHSGWDNRTFRLGDELSVRLPSAAGYVAQVAKEQRWLPVLAGELPWPIPEPVAQGVPTADYPFPWSVYRWLDGEPAATWSGLAEPAHLVALATDLGAFLTALRAVDPTGGPVAGQHSFYRGDTLDHYATGTEKAVTALADRLGNRVEPVRAVWRQALASRWDAAGVWVHGDVAVGNLLITDDRLSAVIDFGCAAVGDPACDLVLAWTLFDADSRTTWREAVGLDDATWARARGWALWKALITIEGLTTEGADDSSAEMIFADRTLDAVLADLS